MTVERVGEGSREKHRGERRRRGRHPSTSRVIRLKGGGGGKKNGTSGSEDGAKKEDSEEGTGTIHSPRFTSTFLRLSAVGLGWFIASTRDYCQPCAPETTKGLRISK